eukprot:1162113-Pelagomonas_calceolata.AAC.9
MIELWALFGRFEARGVIWGPPIANTFWSTRYYKKIMVGMVRFEKEYGKEHVQRYGGVVQLCNIRQTSEEPFSGVLATSHKASA